jgi:hypothetical protein
MSKAINNNTSKLSWQVKEFVAEAEHQDEFLQMPDWPLSKWFVDAPTVSS